MTELQETVEKYARGFEEYALSRNKGIVIKNINGNTFMKIDSVINLMINKVEYEVFKYHKKIGTYDTFEKAIEAFEKNS